MQRRRLRTRRGATRISRCGLILAAFSLICWGVNGESAVSQRSLPDGPGQEETRKLCSGCHELEKSYSIKQDRPGWQRTIDKMIDLGAKGSEDEFNTVLEYLVTHFRADEVPRIDVNRATAIELESGLSLKRSQAAAVIRYRYKHGNFKGIEDLKRVPGIDAARIEAKKDRLVFSQ